MRFWRLGLLFVMVVVSASFMPVSAQQPQGITCEGNLIVTASFTPIAYGTISLVGTGPGGPFLTPGPVALAGVPLNLSWTLTGPGTWTGLVLYFFDGETTTYLDIPITLTCQPLSAAPPPGCTVFVQLPKQAVVGQFNWNSEIYWAPGRQIFPMLMVEAGNTYYVAGQDESETYYKVLISCQWVWVRKDTVGPNYDEVWQGTPLPMDIVE